MTTIESGTAIGIEYIAVGDARGRDPRGGARGRRPRLHEGRGVDAALDPDARRLARPPPGAREGGAVQPLPQRRGRRGSSGRSARWPRSASSTARTRTASAATSSPRRRRRPHGRRLGDGPGARRSSTPLDDETEEQARERVLKRFEEIGVQIMNRTSGGGPFTENPIAGVLCDPREARAGGADPRPGLRLRLQPRAPQQGRGRADRRRARRAAGGLRRRARRRCSTARS